MNDNNKKSGSRYEQPNVKIGTSMADKLTKAMFGKEDKKRPKISDAKATVNKSGGIHLSIPDGLLDKDEPSEEKKAALINFVLNHTDPIFTRKKK